MSKLRSPPFQGQILDCIRRFWGYESLRPLQAEAIETTLVGRDSLVVLPTGGGKSLCYQVPPLITKRTDIVVSPLISLMKDQVDGLVASGYPAVAVHSGMSRKRRLDSLEQLSSGKCRLALVSPERLLMPRFLEMIKRREVKAFAIDEAHCISHWGHDFRPEYRKLASLRKHFPAASIHAYTATATERVQQDIVEQLALRDPSLLVGRFDRPNLVYRIVPRQDVQPQVFQVLSRHPKEASIVYCITRDETDRMADFLQGKGLRATSYHAGMNSSGRRAAQEAFSNEELDVIVATVAFGMGIDRGDVRCVIHVGMPKSIEHYQQETGRAGRDGLEAECVLFYSPADVLRWKSIVNKSAEEARVGKKVRETLLHLIEEMRRYCLPGACRHRRLVEYFGQRYEGTNCKACDICLGETEDLVDGTTDAQKILSCVARLDQRFGIGHVVDVLAGAKTERIDSLGHHRLSTYGLLQKDSKKALVNKVYQLVDQGLLARTEGEYPVLRLNRSSTEVLRGGRKVLLMPVRPAKVKKAAVEREAWKGVNRDLFEALRDLRSRLARQRGVPPYVIFGDRTLREMARSRPSDRQELLLLHGVGEKKLEDFGDAFLSVILEYQG